MGEVVKHMLLTIDVGNTHTVLGTWHDDELTYRWRVRTDASQTADQARIMLNSLFALDGIAPRDVEGVILATVVPALNRLWSKVALDLCGRKALSIDSEMVGSLLNVSTIRGVSVQIVLLMPLLHEHIMAIRLLWSTLVPPPTLK